MSSQGHESKASLHNRNGSAWVPKVNGKHNKHVKDVSLKVEGELSQGISVSRMIQANIPMYKEVLPGLESWLTSKIASWHNVERHSILWLCVVSIDRRGNSSFLPFQLIMVQFHLVCPVYILSVIFDASRFPKCQQDSSFFLFVQLLILIVAY